MMINKMKNIAGLQEKYSGNYKIKIISEVTKHVNSLHTYMHAIEICSEDNRYRNNDEVLLFRGQPAECKLLPKIARELNILNQEGCSRKKGFLELEQDMFNCFKRMLVPHLQKIPDSDLDILAIGQHFGLSTRLLDWTENPLVALFFAIPKGTVWILRVNKRDILDPKKESNPFCHNETKVFRPSLLNNRLIAQKGWFTLHSFNKKENIFIPIEEEEPYPSNLMTIKVFGNSIINQLDKCGINSSTLFPDISGLSNYLNRTWHNEMFIAFEPPREKGKRKSIKAPKIRSLVQPISKAGKRKN